MSKTPFWEWEKKEGCMSTGVHVITMYEVGRHTLAVGKMD